MSMENGSLSPNATRSALVRSLDSKPRVIGMTVMKDSEPVFCHTKKNSKAL